MSQFQRWAPYVPVAQRRAQASRAMADLTKKGVSIQPVRITGRTIASTFWGKGWCQHLESFGDYSNRLPRGRTYVRNGSVCHLGIGTGSVEARVSGSSLYKVKVTIAELSPVHWKQIKKKCAGQIGSLLELLQGRLSANIMSVVTNRQNGLFPKPGQIQYTCDCPDWASMCKHIAAVMYGIGARLDQDPALLFKLRGVNHEELIEADVAAPAGTGKGKSRRLVTQDSLSDVFGIDIEAPSQTKKKATTKKATAQRTVSAAQATKTKTEKASIAGPSKSSIRQRSTRKKKKASNATIAAVAVPTKPRKTATSKVQATSSPTLKKKTTKKKATTKPLTMQAAASKTAAPKFTAKRKAAVKKKVAPAAKASKKAAPKKKAAKRKTAVK